MSNLKEMKGKDILVLSPSEWQDNAVSNMQISAILSKHNKVLYVETMGGRMPKLSELGRVFRRLIRSVKGVSNNVNQHGLDQCNVSILSPIAIPIHGNIAIDWLNKNILSFQIKRQLEKLNMSNLIVWFFSPRWESILDSIDRKCLIFHCVDALNTYDNSTKFKDQFERVSSKADLVFTPGILLEQRLKKLNNHTFRIGHGCGSDHFKHPEGGYILPKDLENIPEPRVVYAGTLANWIDYELLIQVAILLPKFSFVLIGYIHVLTPKDKIQILQNLNNVHLVGYKNFSILPQYYCHSSIGIVPYQANNEHIRYSTPTKLLDYLAAGLTPVSTRYPAATDMDKWVVCAGTPEKFADAIRVCLQMDSSEAKISRKRHAQKYTWEKQVQRMTGYIDQYFEGRLDK
jgi:glycosyltransferase involved in cell wall biosynthesis